MEQDSQQPKETTLDPGTVVASGSALLVRLMVPAWIVNATSLSISGAHSLPIEIFQLDLMLSGCRHS